MKHNTTTLEFVVNGNPFKVRVDRAVSMELAAAWAIEKAAKTQHMPPEVVEKLELRDAAGALVERNRSVRALGIANGARLFLSMRPGVAA